MPKARRAKAKQKKASKRTVKMRIIGRDLPGSRFTKAQGALVDRESVHVGIETKKEVIALVRGDSEQASFSFPLEVTSGSKTLDFYGPFVDGEKGKRYLLLSWGEVSGNGDFATFRRAKIPLPPNSKEILASLSSEDPSVEVSLPMTDGAGGPICATIKSEKMEWIVA